MTKIKLNKEDIIYIYDQKLCFECNRLPCALKRGSIVQDLINCYGLMDHVVVKKSTPATEDDLKLCHSSCYIDFIRSVSETDDLDKYYDEQEEYGLGYDCPILERMYDFVTTIAGGSLTAAKCLVNRECKVAVNWFGGWHHAQRDAAEGFCYVNDIAIAIQKMSETYKKILYVDFDIHHGNGVQNIFETSQRIVTLSFHKHMPGFYPGSGSLEDLGFSKGKYYSLNVPLLEGVGNSSFQYVFEKIFPRICESFQPNALVVQCGSDGIKGDPIGQSNLTPKIFGDCVRQILELNVPTLFLGGGGYNFPNAARNWAYLTSIIAGQTLPNDIPDECMYFMQYGPDFELDIPSGNRKDTNTKEYLNTVVDTIFKYCEHLNINTKMREFQNSLSNK